MARIVKAVPVDAIFAGYYGWDEDLIFLGG